MPNWINNHWDITAPPEIIKEIDALLFDRDDEGKRTHMRFERILPMPDILHKTVARGGLVGEVWMEDENDSMGRPATPEERADVKATGYDDWWWWSVKTWGTKWEVGDSFEITFDEDDHLMVTFQTAWDPPRGVIDALRKRYDHVEGVYIEATYETEI